MPENKMTRKITKAINRRAYTLCSDLYYARIRKAIKDEVRDMIADGLSEDEIIEFIELNSESPWASGESWQNFRRLA